MGVDPYAAGGDPNHPGVSGKTYGESPVGPQDVDPRTMDSPGTGTFSPEQQGNVNRAEPTGLSAASQANEMITGDPAGPVSAFPEPTEEGEVKINPAKELNPATAKAQNASSEAGLTEENEDGEEDEDRFS